MNESPKFDLRTSEGGRGYIAHHFKTALKRHDFTGYITERLAADFACALARHFEDNKAREAVLQVLLTAADERVDMLEGGLLAATPSKVCKCRECGGTSLTWYSHIKSNSGVAEGRLRTSEMSCVFFLGCDDCSETLAWMDADKIAAGLPIRKP